MERIELQGASVEFETHGGGQPVVLVHARPFVSWFQPLLAYLGSRAVLLYRREFSHDSSFGVEDDARLCARLLAHVGFERPHVVGHSYGALVALEMARQQSADVRSVALLEPATSGLLAPSEASARSEPLLRMARDQGAAAAMQYFLRAVCGDRGCDELEALVPGAVAEALTHAQGFFDVELPACVRWSFTVADAPLVTCPVLNLLGSLTAARFREGATIIESWFPSAESGVLVGASHLMMAQQPEAAAACLTRFWDQA